MEKSGKDCDLAMVERGKVEEASGGQYKVSSYSRDGLTTPWLSPLHSGDSYSVGDKVFFFMFEDGQGRIIGEF